MQDWMMNPEAFSADYEELMELLAEEDEDYMVCEIANAQPFRMTDPTDYETACDLLEQYEELRPDSAFLIYSVREYEVVITF